MTTETIEIPDRGVTVLPPWGAFIVLANKRHENRSASVAGAASKYAGNGIRPYRRIAITASKTWDEHEYADATQSLWMAIQSDSHSPTAMTARDMLHSRLPQQSSAGPLKAWVNATAGHIIGVAELVDVVANGAKPANYWQVPWQHSLVLGRVWQVEPVKCSGGRGFFKFAPCVGCSRPIAQDYGDRCRRCVPDLVYPERLKVVAIRDADGW